MRAIQASPAPLAGAGSLVGSDEDIVERARDYNDQIALEHIFSKYNGLVRLKAKRYFLVGADRDDIIQEGMIGLYKAIRDFRRDKLSSFRAFADLCVTRQIITAIKAATRQKHQLLNHSISVDRAIDEEDAGRTLLDTLVAPDATDPHAEIERQEVSEEVRERIFRDLSPLEAEVLTCYLSGRTYQEMADVLGRHLKSVDNALQRAKRKIEQAVEEKLDLFQ